MPKFPPIEFSDTEYNAFGASHRFTLPFYISTVQGVYEIGERMSYSAGQVYIILRKIKVKSVIATVGGVSLKIPLDYEGKFSIIGHNNNPLNMTEIMELSDIETYIIEVRLSDLEQHGKHFLDTIDSIGRGIRTCNFKLIEETTDEYFIGRSSDGSLVMIFSTEANMTFQVKETSAEDMQHLFFNVEDLKYDVFVTDVSVPAIKFFTTKEVINFPPPRPPKPKPTGRSDLTMPTGTSKPEPPAKPVALLTGKCDEETDAHREGVILNKDPNTDLIKMREKSEEQKEELSPKPNDDEPQPSPPTLPPKPKHNHRGKSQPSPTLPTKRNHARGRSEPSRTLSPKFTNDQAEGKPQTSPIASRNHDSGRSQPSTTLSSPQSLNDILGSSSWKTEHSILKFQSSKYVDDINITTELPGQSEEPSGESPSLEKPVTNPRKQSSRQPNKEFVHSFHKGGKDVQIIFSPDRPPLPPKKKTLTPTRKIPPPLPLDPYRSDDDEYSDGKVLASDSPRFPPLSEEHTYKRSIPAPPSRDFDTDDEYDIKLTGAVGKEFDSDAGSDYEQPMSDTGEDYELVDEPMQHMPDDIRKRYENLPPKSPKSPDSPNALKRMFSIRKQLNNQFKKKISKLNKTKKQLSGEMADDELTEDPYAEQKQDAQRKKIPKRPTRNRNDPLPSPTSLTISSPIIHSPGASPRSSPLPKLPYDSPQQPGDSDSGSDYEKIDDDVDVVNIPRRPPMSTPIKLHGVKPRLQSHPLPAVPPKSLLRGYPQPLPDIPPNQGITSDIGPPVKDQSSAVTLPDKTADKIPSTRPPRVAVVQPTQTQYQFPTDLSNLGMEAIAKALQHLNIPDETIDTFREAQIDGQIFVCLDDSMLDELGVKRFHKLKLIRFKNGWRPT